MMDHGGDVGCPGSGEREELARRREQRMSAAKIAASLPLSGRTGKTRRGRPEKEKPRNPNKIENEVQNRATRLRRGAVWRLELRAAVPASEIDASQRVSCVLDAWGLAMAAT
jgi:hypothetical protein